MQGHRCCLRLMGLLVACLLLAPLAAGAQSPKYGGTLRVAWEADVTGFDPHTSPGVQSQYMVGNLFNGMRASTSCWIN
jgi:ABC-type oligopeptide transport system substrate-binding subunit